MIEGLTMAQCISSHYSNRSVVCRSLEPFIMSKTGPILLVLVGLTGGMESDSAFQNFLTFYRLYYSSFCFV